jgi:enterochelin esterase family protein
MHRAALTVLTFMLHLPLAFSADEPLTPKSLQAALKSPPGGAEAERLAESVRKFFGKEALAKGSAAKVDGRTVAWAVSSPMTGAAPRVVSEIGKLDLPLQRIGETDVYAAVREFPHGTALRYLYVIGERKFSGDDRNPRGRQLEVYDAHPDSKPVPDVPKGEVRQMPKWESKIYAGTTRDWWIYVPTQYKPEKPACVMVFQDGQNYKDVVAPVFDNLIHKGDMPVTVGVFITPGVFKQGGRSNRSFEYDTLSDQYARFLLEEMLPETEKHVKLRHDGQSRAIAGISSGGICSFTVAWERPNEFSKVLSWVGSFTNIASGESKREGGHNYQALVRKTPKKPIRIYLQDGANDLDNEHGNWPQANLTLARSLQFKGYDYHLEYGEGFHSPAHGRALLPESLRWLWRDYKAD